MLIGLSFGKKEKEKKGLEGSLKKTFGEIKDKMNENFCNVKTLKDSEIVLRF